MFKPWFPGSKCGWVPGREPYSLVPLVWETPYSDFDCLEQCSCCQNNEQCPLCVFEPWFPDSRYEFIPRRVSYPADVALASKAKRDANILVRDAFEAFVRKDSRVVILDTPALRTTQTLLNSTYGKLIQILIVERDRYEAAAMRKAVKSQGLQAQVVVVTMDVFVFLASSSRTTDCVWLDLMSSTIPYPKLVAAVDQLQIQCLAVTLPMSMHSTVPYNKRMKKLEVALGSLLPHKLLEWGYRLAAGHRDMTLAIFGKKHHSILLPDATTCRLP